MDKPTVHFETAADWREWLEANHASSSGVFLVSWRSTTGRAAIGYVDAVEQALCFGWVDSIKKVLDDDRGAQWFGPRKPGGTWARTNKERVERLTAEGLMRPSGIAVVEAARADGSWNILDDVDALIVPADLERTFAQHPGAAETFAGFPPSARWQALHWIVLAKTAPTRERRVNAVAAGASRGDRVSG